MATELLNGMHVVAVARFGAAFPARNSWSTHDAKPAVEYLTAALKRVSGDRGTVLSLTPDTLTVTFGHDDGAALGSVTDLQEQLRDAYRPSELGTVGLTRGELWFRQLPGVSAPVAFGPALERANELASIARAGAILVDAGVVAGQAMEYVRSDDGAARGRIGHDYFSSVCELRYSTAAPPVAFHEFIWAAEAFGVTTTGEAASSPSSGQWVPVMIASSGDGPLVAETSEGRFALTDPELDLEPGPAFASSGGEATWPPRIQSIIKVGSTRSATVRKVFPDRGYAFLDLDGSDLFMHRADNDWPVEPDDIIEFEVGKNERGPIAVGGRRVASHG